MGASIGVSVLILTKNEEQDLPGCIESLRFSDDIVVLDSLSTDKTTQIAREMGARVVERSFDNWSSHQNWAMENIPFKYDWVYYSDADERVTPALAKEILEKAADPAGNVAFRMPRRDYFMGKWLKHCIPSPFNIRLFRHDCMRYERIINPVPTPKGTVGEMVSHFDHFPFSKGMSHWMAKHNSYSTLEAQQIIAERQAGTKPSLKEALFCKDRNERRRHQKGVFYRLPLRPLAKFFIFYVLRFGFLDGVAGFRYCALQSIYEYMIVLKVKEIEAGGS